MKLWMVERKRDFGYDEYDAFIVRAETADEALHMGITKEPKLEGEGNSLVTEVFVEGESEIILSSFNAG